MALTKVSYSMIQGAPFNVLDFGAVGDGVTNDSAAVQAAIDAVADVGFGTVYFPPGKSFYLDTQINVCDNLTVMGYGSKIICGSSYADIDAPLFKNFSGTKWSVPGTRIASENISFYGLEITGNDTGSPGASIPNADMHGAIIGMGGWDADSGVTGLVIKDCYMHDFAGSGAMIWKSENVEVSDNRFVNFFSNVSLSVGSGIDFHEVEGAIISDNLINHTSAAYSWHGIVVLDWDIGSKNINISNNVIRDMNYGDGISCEGNTNNNLENSVICGNIIENCNGQGIGIDNCVSAIVSDNQINSVAGPGILFTKTENVIITNNTIATSGLGGITSFTGVFRAVVSNNKITGITYYNSTYRGEGINVTDDSGGSFQQITITGNVTKDTSGAGIYASGTNCVIQGNSIENAGTSTSLGNVLRAGIVSSAYGCVSNNYIRSLGPTQYGISGTGSDFPSISGNEMVGTFAQAYYYIAYRGTGINHNISVSIEDAKYDAVSNSFTGRYNGTPSGYWYQGDTFYNTAPTSGGYIGSVVTTTPSTWKTFGLIS